MIFGLGMRYATSAIKLPMMAGLMLGISTCGFGVMHTIKSSVQNEARQEILLDVISQEDEERQRLEGFMNIIDEHIEEINEQGDTSIRQAEEDFTFSDVERNENDTMGDGVCDYYDVLPPWPSQ